MNTPSRRSFLTAGAASTLVPLLSRRLEAAGPPRRVIFFFTPNGQPPAPTWWGATGTETAFTFNKTLAPLEPVKKDILLLEGMDFVSYKMQSPVPPNDHPPVLGHVLTANDVLDPMDGSKPAASSTWFAGHVSIDQFIAGRVGSATRFPSLVLGVRAGGPLARMSYRGPRDPVPPNSDPKKAWDSLFAGVTGGDPAVAERLRAQRKSVLDVTTGELSALERRLPSDDRMKLQAHLDRLRTVEARLAAQVQTAGCKPSPLASDPNLNTFVLEGRQQMDNIVQALACDLTRVVSLQWSVASTGMAFPWLNEMMAHHGLAHAPGTDAIMERMSVIGSWYATQLKYLVDQLARIPEGNGNVLQNTIIVWYNEHGSPRGGHPRTNVPFLLAGGGGGALRPGRSLKYKNASHADLFVSLAQAMGLSDVTTFGKREACTGPLAGLK